MFPKDSAFTTRHEVVEHMEEVRKEAINHFDENKSQRRSTEKLAAYDMLKAAELFIDEEQYAEAGELVRRAAELLINADTVSDN